MNDLMTVLEDYVWSIIHVPFKGFDPKGWYAADSDTETVLSAENGCLLTVLLASTKQCHLTNQSCYLTMRQPGV